VIGLDHVVQIALSDTQSCALRLGGEVVCWGGFLRGVDTETEGLRQMLPTRDATRIDAGGETGLCALSASLGLYCWGRTAIDDRETFAAGQVVPLAPDLELAQVSLGGDIRTDPYWVWALAIDVDGHVLRPSSSGGFSLDERWPLAVTTVGQLASLELECGLQIDGRPFCMRRYTAPPSGPGELHIDRVRSLSVGHSAVCMARETGEVACAGDDSLGALGLGSLDNDNWDYPMATVEGITDAVQVATIDHYGCALRASGAVACWGFSEYGATGRAWAGTEPWARDVAGVSDAVEIAVAARHACARLRDGRVACWGWEGRALLASGALGRGPRRFDSPQRVRF
jgi:hypothetical protein